MYYTVYKITNKINNKIYIGVHKTLKLDDEYMGSGKHLKRAQEKYGIENFYKEILEVFEYSAMMYQYEALLVNEEFVSRDDTYNLKVGGFGGFGYINENGLNYTFTPEDTIKARQKVKEMKENDLITWGGSIHWTEESRDKVSKNFFGNRKDFNPDNWSKMTDERKNEVKTKISEALKGENNGQFGNKVYVNSETHEKKRFKIDPGSPWILKTELLEKLMENSRRWFNDGKKNYLIFSNDGRIEEFNLQKGRYK